MPCSSSAVRSLAPRRVPFLFPRTSCSSPVLSLNLHVSVLALNLHVSVLARPARPPEFPPAGARRAGGRRQGADGGALQAGGKHLQDTELVPLGPLLAQDPAPGEAAAGAGPRLCFKRGGAGSALLPPLALVFGGTDGAKFHTTIEGLLPGAGGWASAGAWREFHQMDAARFLPLVAPAAGRAWVFGGFDGERILASARVFTPPQDEDLETEGAYGSWEKLPDMPRARMAGAAVALGAHILLLGGCSKSKAALASVDVFDTLTREWLPSGECPPPLPAPRTECAALVAGGRLWVVGGSDAAGWHSDAWVLALDDKGRWDAWAPAESLSCPVSSAGPLALVLD